MKDKLLAYLTGVLLVGVAVLGIAVAKTRYHLPHDVARLGDVTSALFKAHQDLGIGPVADCQSAVTAGVENSGGDKPSFGLATVVPDKSGKATDVYLHVNSSVYHGWAECVVHKSVWQVLGNGPSGPPPKGNKPAS